MTYRLTILGIAAFLLIGQSVYAQTKTATPSATIAPDLEKIKEKVAEKVQELKKNERSYAGIITRKDDDEWEIESLTGEKSKISIDGSLTGFYSVSGKTVKEIKQEEMKEKDYVFVTGPMIDDAVTANAVYKYAPSLVFSGKITSVDSAAFVVKVLGLDKTTYDIDIERSTSQQMMNIKTLQFEKIGFSKLKEGDTIHVAVQADLADPKKTKFSAVRILVIPNEYFMQ